jgi:hypothetical protein
MGFLVDKEALTQVCIGLMQLHHVNTFKPVLHTHIHLLLYSTKLEAHITGE